mmetsp:Transcript_18910/g.57450  ORF Transcript_18910/g.57450 Transcript_18910/m.57450 type:complete len:443 (-) Transcript_18910:100-1428(-)
MRILGGVTLAMRLARGSGFAPPAPVAGGLRGVVLDLDGTLVDTEYLSPVAWSAVLREVGVDIDADALGEDISRPELRGAGAMQVAQHLIDAHGIAPERIGGGAAWMAERKKSLAVGLVVSREVDLNGCWFPGVTEALAKLEDKVGAGGIGLCTSNLRPVVRMTLRAGGLFDGFGGGRTVQEDVDELKPSAEPYARALSCMGRPAAAVAAVEDSVVGVKAALNAGVGCVIGVLNRDEAAAEEREGVAKALLEAGASGIFETTAEAIDWCAENAAEDAAACAAAAAPSRAEAAEEVVYRYFDGVNDKDPELIRSCFAPTVTLRDMCGITKGTPRTATPGDMADRCMEFLTAHPDCAVRFEAPPRADRAGRWVWAHWTETGTWKGESCGVAPAGTPLDVGGHTRFLVEEVDGELKIAKQVVYRTFSEWEVAVSAKSAAASSESAP